MEPAITFICLFAAIFGVLYVFFTTRTKERLAMIEKGAEASLFDRRGSKFSIAKFILNLALLMTGIGIGILAGSMFGSLNPFLNKDVTIASMIFIFGGLGLVVGFFITRKIEKADNK